MVVEAAVRVRHAGCVMERLTGGAHVAHISADRDADILVAHAADAAQLDSFLDALRAGQAVPLEVVSRTPTSAVVRARHPPGGSVAGILASGCSILWPALYADGWESFTVLAPSRDRLEGLVRRLRQLGEARLERVVDVPADALDVSVPLADLAADLTERQLAILQRAIGEGYYASPRRTSTEALASEFGVSRSTFEEHLRKAERRVLERFASVLASQPALARSARRKPGRPAKTPG